MNPGLNVNGLNKSGQYTPYFRLPETYYTKKPTFGRYNKAWNRFRLLTSPIFYFFHVSFSLLETMV